MPPTNRVALRLETARSTFSACPSERAEEALARRIRSGEQSAEAAEAAVSQSVSQRAPSPQARAPARCGEQTQAVKRASVPTQRCLDVCAAAPVDFALSFDLQSDWLQARGRPISEEGNSVIKSLVLGALVALALSSSADAGCPAWMHLSPDGHHCLRGKAPKCPADMHLGPNGRNCIRNHENHY